MLREVKLKMRKLRKSRYGVSKKRYPVNASTAISFEGLDGRTHRVNLDFDDPRHLYDFFDETLGRDFTDQFKDELNRWTEFLHEDIQGEYGDLIYKIDDCNSGVHLSIEDAIYALDELNTELKLIDAQEADPGIMDESIRIAKQLKLLLDSAMKDCERLGKKIEDAGY